MVTVIVKYKTGRNYTREEITEIMQLGAEHMFKGMPHLLSKQFCFNVDTSEGLSVYLWDSREQAEAFFTGDFLESFKQGMGTVPTIEYHQTILTVDNRANDIIMAS